MFTCRYVFRSVFVLNGERGIISLAGLYEVMEREMNNIIYV